MGRQMGSSEGAVCYLDTQHVSKEHPGCRGRTSHFSIRDTYAAQPRMFPLSAFYLTAERHEAQGRKPEGSVLTLRKENGVVWVFVYLPQLKWIPTVLLSGKRVTSGRSRLLEDEGTFYI